MINNILCLLLFLDAGSRTCQVSFMQRSGGISQVSDANQLTIAQMLFRRCRLLHPYRPSLPTAATRPRMPGTISSRTSRMNTRAPPISARRSSVSQFTSRNNTAQTHRPRRRRRYIARFKVSIPTRKLHLSALRAFFDLLVTRHIMLVNPASSVHGLKYEVVKGKTHEVSIEHAKKLLASIHVERKIRDDQIIPLVVGLRDRAVIATLIYTAARAAPSHACASRTSSTTVVSGRFALSRKGESPAKSRCVTTLRNSSSPTSRHMPGWRTLKNEPIFRTAIRKTGTLTATAMTNIDICRMVKRRLADAKLPVKLSPHSFRVTTITDLLTQGVPLEDVQYLAGHADPRTTRLYDRRQKQVTRNIVEKVSI